MENHYSDLIESVDDAEKYCAWFINYIKSEPSLEKAAEELGLDLELASESKESLLRTFLGHFFYYDMNLSYIKDGEFKEFFLDNVHKIRRALYFVFRSSPHVSVSASFSNGIVISEAVIPNEVFFGNPEFFCGDRERVIEASVNAVREGLMLNFCNSRIREKIVEGGGDEATKGFIEIFYNGPDKDYIKHFHANLKANDYRLYSHIIETFNIPTIEEMEAEK